MDAEEVRSEMRQTRASIDRKLDLLSVRTAELSESAKIAAQRTAGATLVSIGASIALSWWKRHA